jgi:hypothetical protein
MILIGARLRVCYFYRCVSANVLGNLLEYICVTTKNVVKFDGLHQESVPCRCLMGCLLAYTYILGSQSGICRDERKKSVIDC